MDLDRGALRRSLPRDRDRRRPQCRSHGAATRWATRTAEPLHALSSPCRACRPRRRGCGAVPPRRHLGGNILYFHGGGFVSGGVGLERRPAAANALATRCDVYSVEYRLAPRHPYPAALDDAVMAYQAVLARGADPTTAVLFGGSAGACLALSTLLRIRDEGLPRPAGAVLLWPYADFTFSGETITTNAHLDMMPIRDLAHMFGPAYVGDADPSDPLVSPALADLTGLPPLLVIAGGAESLLSCAQRIAGNADRDRVPVALSVYPEKVHGWMILSRLPATSQAIDELQAWISERIAPTTPQPA